MLPPFSAEWMKFSSIKWESFKEQKVCWKLFCVDTYTQES